MKKILISIFILILLMPLTQAWGIAYVENHFTLKTGQKQDVKFSMQNYVGDEPKRIVIELSGDKEIATILDKKDYYLLPPKTKDHEVIIQINIPEKAKKNYKVKVNFIAYTSSSGIGLSTAKVIPVYIEVPDGTIEEQLQETSLDLTETYQKVEEKIEKKEGQTPDTKTQSLTILKEKGSTSNLLPLVLIIAGLLVLLILITTYLKKRRRRKLEWI